MVACLAALVVVTAPPAPAAGAASLEAVPARVKPGDAFLVVVRGEGPGAAVSAAGRSFPLYPVPGGRAAVVGLPVETAAGRLALDVVGPEPDAGAGAHADAGVGAAPLSGAVEVEGASFPKRSFDVQRRFVEPPSPEVQRRVEEDRAAFARAFAQPPEAPLFDAPFAWPRRARVTARYGEQRTLNGVKPSQHYGTDLAGKVGAPVAAANAGRVVLVRDCWASGRSVIVWHGAGLYTTYFHLSRTLVREGETVERGRRIGLVGATGRVSGPHLHWGVKVADLYVDPESVLRLRLPARR
jgi:murein DD-endopeptidase MepM/ murein hydrolase activator NlpD